MMRRASMLAWVVSLQRSFLPAIALENSRVQIQRVALTAARHPFHLPLRQMFEQALHVAHREAPEQIADRVVGGEAVDPQQRVKSSISAQPVGMRKPFCTH